VSDAAAIWVSSDGQMEIATSGPRILLGGESRNDTPVKRFRAENANGRTVEGTKMFIGKKVVPVFAP